MQILIVLADRLLQTQDLRIVQHDGQWEHDGLLQMTEWNTKLEIQEHYLYQHHDMQVQVIED